MNNTFTQTSQPPEPWNKGKWVGQKAPFKLQEVWAIQVRNIGHGDRAAARATVMQQKTSRPVQFKITEQTRTAVADWMKTRNLHSEDYLFPSRVHNCPHLGTRHLECLSSTMQAVQP